ncbi:MAG: bacillithiol biosynthesis deacetylase BshB1 [Verrucomicrobia bacterium]|nr:bacillithiol biosynthesis deacetylase BshB1 [Cytophagales bacterium]
MKLDILVLAAHPDDAELACGGTLLAHVAMGKKVGIVDFTQGELGTRGTAETRRKEAEKASQILSLSVRENLGLADAFFENNAESRLKVITAIRKYQPDIVLANAISDRHADHGKAAKLATDACFYAGLQKIETFWEGKPQAAHRPKVVYHYIQDHYLTPDFVMDITPFWEKKMLAIKAFETQFYNPDLQEPQTTLSSPDFLRFLESRAREFGRSIGCNFGEGFTKERYLGVNNLFDLV